MSRSSITDKGGTQPKSEWFGFKYRVTPESSKLLQEAVFKDGGRWPDYSKDVREISYFSFWLFVKPDGELSWSTLDVKGLPEKQPPQPAKKDFVVSKWYKCICGGAEAIVGTYYRVDGIGDNMLYLQDTQGRVISGIFAKRFDINSESDYDPNTAQPEGYTAYVVFKQYGCNSYESKEYAYKCSRDDYRQLVEYRAFDEDVFAEVNVSGVEKNVKVVRIEANVDPKATKSIVRILPKELAKDVETSRINNIIQVTINRDDFFSKQALDYPTSKEENIMSTNNQRKTVTVNLIDRDSALDEKFALVATFGEFTTSKSSEALIRSIIIDPKNDVAKLIAQHNEVRVKQTNKEIMERTGNKVTLEPVEESDLYWEIR